MEEIVEEREVLGVDTEDTTVQVVSTEVEESLVATEGLMSYECLVLIFKLLECFGFKLILVLVFNLLETLETELELPSFIAGFFVIKFDAAFVL